MTYELIKEPGEKKPKMDWYYDGQSWVYADKPPEKKPPSIEKVKEAEKVSLNCCWEPFFCTVAG